MAVHVGAISLFLKYYITIKKQSNPSSQADATEI